MTALAAAFVLCSFVAAIILVRPAARRTALGAWHPALAWLCLELLFLGIGSAVLAVRDQRPGPAAYVGGAALAFALGVAASDRLAGARAQAGATRREAEAAPIRRWAVIALVGVGLLALLPTLLTVGIPFFSGDITAARSEVSGLDLQILRVALPAAAVVAIIRAVTRGTARSRMVAVGIVGVGLTAELLIANRYLAAELGAAIVIGLALARRPIPGRWLSAIAAVAIGLFVLIGILRAWDQAVGRELDFAFGRTVNRIVLIEPRTLDALQTVIPAERPHFDGLTWLRRFGPLLGRDDIPNLGYWIYPRLFPEQVVPGYAATGLVGEAWANFGWLGLVLFAALGSAVERLGAWVVLRRVGTADIAVAALLTLFVARTHALGLNGLLVLVALTVGWRLTVASPAGLARDARVVFAWRT